MTRNSRSPLKLICIGLAAGVMSGMFGVGGGTIIVPLLLFWVGMDHRLAAGTSVAAILPTAVVGTVSYGVQGNIDWIAAVCLAVGVVLGAQVGSWLLSRVSQSALQLAFMVFLVIVIVSLWFIVPHRESVIDLNIWSVILLAVTGLITGILSGLLGVGGGVIVVPVLMFFFASSDLIAKGTSLAMMIPGSLSGTVGNSVRKNVDLAAAAMIGLTACVAIPFATILAAAVDPFVGNILFSFYLVFVFGQLLQKRISRKRRGTE